MLYDEKTESLRITETASENGMRKLPDWVIANKYPAIYDLESTTAIEQTARLYGAVQTLIENYNTFITIVEEDITNMSEQYALDNETYKIAVRQIMQDFFDDVETKMQLQDAKIASIENTIDASIKREVNANIDNAIERAISEGRITFKIDYNEENEEILIVA